MAKFKHAVLSLNVAEAKKQFSDLLGRVAYAGETIVIMRRGKPMAKLVPAEAEVQPPRLARVRGWLENDDSFFSIVDEIVSRRAANLPRILARMKGARRRR
ncbi:MAG: type II toxin-antitoxin system prevent-host-death family antitoxin [Planctomycetes bacterium]|nr:type II toxin-antitoxin system prevent-host-death family antitoxin [Planctomycetota bacterium]